MNLLGYVRQDGRMGIRNHVAVISSVHCVSHVAERIAELTGAVAITHDYGCGQEAQDYEATRRICIGAGNNPNVAAALVIGLGCEHLRPDDVASQIKGKPVEYYLMQEEGGTTRLVEKGVRTVDKFRQHASTLGREEVALSRLTMGVRCGASDAGSGIASNPVLGIASDLLVAEGGTVIQSGIRNLFGIDHILARRAANQEVRKKILDYLDRMWAMAQNIGLNPTEVNPSPGNVQGGLTTLIEKAIGGFKKGGSSPIQGFLKRGEAVNDGKGLWFMETTEPGDVFALSEMVAGGAQLLAFTTGRGTPVGSPITPTIKLCHTKHTVEWMADNIDFDSSPVIAGEETIEDCGQRLFDLVVAVANGKKTRAEVLGHKEFAIAGVSTS